ncbi:inositol-3-phosphate synthase [Bacillus cereus]|nr:inositol-3-phosphate synthase [Bacillus cereus]
MLKDQLREWKKQSNQGKKKNKTKNHSLYQSLKAFETGLRENSSDIRPSMLYAYAAMRSKCAYVNFTPNVTTEIPALQELAELQAVPTAGKDGRTGQILYKHVLGKMFKQRGLNIVGGYSMNILGNQDGAVLEHPTHSSTKIDLKSIGLEQILGYSNFDHKVRIDYFPVRGDRKEAWDTIDFEGWLGERMTMKINWLGVDSILAAPLIIDLSRFMDHALRERKVGIMEHLSLFFKSPIGTDEYALDTGQLSKVTLQKNGHAKWFTIPQEAAGKTMTVELPSGSSFAVYDENGVCVNFTVVSENNKVKLPENGTVVFAGAPNSEFTIALN